MIRPELSAAFRRWSEAIWAGAGVLIAVWVFFRGGWLMQGLGALFGLLAFGLLLTAIRRARFHTGQDGPGVVQLDEGRIRYFGPFDGGAVSIGDLSHVEIGPTRQGAVVWLLHSDDQPVLLIPTAAKGGEAMFDAFGTLPGIDMGHLTRATQSPPAERITLWRREARAAHEVLTPR